MKQLFKRWIKQYKCKRSIKYLNQKYEHLGHNFEQIDLKLYSEYPDYAINAYTHKTLDYKIPKHWRITWKCEYCGKMKYQHIHNI